MPESRNYDLKDFDTVVVSMGVRTIITTGGAFSVRAEARDAQTLDRLDVNVVGGRLSIGFARNFMDFLFNGGLVDMILHGADFNVTAYVTLPTLNGAEVSSGGKVEASNVKSDRFRADASSGGQLTLLAMTGGDVRADVSSGARIEIEGTATDLDASASSGGSLRGDKLTSQRGRLEASSGGRLETTVTTRVRANASSGGFIEILGNPSERDINSSSGGNVSIR
jgi:hypothetical protein